MPESSFAPDPCAPDGALPRLTLVLGGARSGKSRFAEAAVERAGAGLYLATSTAGDDEMAARIKLHRERRGPRWTTIEEPLDLARIVITESRADRPILVDCLTLWLSNVMLAERDAEAEIERLLAALAHAGGPLVLVANEVGLGIVPDNALAREFRDAAGMLNQTIARVADEVEFVVAGLPMRVK